MKRFIAVLVCIFMLVSLLPAFAFAEEGGSDPIEATPTPTVEPTQEQTKDTTTTPAPALTQPEEEQQLTSTGAPENTGTSYTVRVSASSTEGGTVTGGGTYNSGESATVTAKANKGYKFVKWTENDADVSEAGATYTFNVTADRTLVAVFEADTTQQDGGNYKVIVTNDGNGTATAAPASGANGTEVTLSAAPNEGYRLKEWQVISGDATITDNKFTIGTANVEVKAIFEEISAAGTYTITVSTDGNGTAIASSASGTTGTEVTLTATPKEGYVFKEWQVVSGGVTISGNKFTIGTANVEIKAIFEEEPYAISVSPTSLDFGKVQAGYTTAPTAQTVTVKNTGNKEITLTQPASTTNYTVGTLSVDTLAPNAEATFTVTPNTGLAAKNEAYSETITVSIDQTNVSASVSAKLVVTGATPTTTSVSLSKTRVVKGETLRITAAVHGQTVHEGTIQLYIDGQPFGSPVALASGNATAWDIPATDANKLALGEHAISAKYSGSAAYAPSESSASKVTVVSPCTPKPPCKPSHYCCGKNHFSGKCVTVRAGEDVTFKVELGCNETCQWYVNKGDGCGFVKIEGATSPRLTLKNVKYKQDGYMYRCIVQNCCDVVSKPIFTLNVASGQLYTPKTGDNGVITVAAGCAAVAALILVGGRRSSRAKQKN